MIDLLSSCYLIMPTCACSPIKVMMVIFDTRQIIKIF